MTSQNIERFAIRFIQNQYFYIACLIRISDVTNSIFLNHVFSFMISQNRSDILIPLTRISIIANLAELMTQAGGRDYIKPRAPHAGANARL